MFTYLQVSTPSEINIKSDFSDSKTSRPLFHKEQNYYKHVSSIHPTDNQPVSQTSTMVSHQSHKPAKIVISGAGIVGLTLALGLKKHIGITPELYEQAPTFQEDIGAGMGMYPNGLRVIRDISPKLLASIRESGYPYLYRRWEVRITRCLNGLIWWTRMRNQSCC